MANRIVRGRKCFSSKGANRERRKIILVWNWETLAVHYRPGATLTPDPSLYNKIRNITFHTRLSVKIQYVCLLLRKLIDYIF